jgi:hypothetical protein
VLLGGGRQVLGAVGPALWAQVLSEAQKAELRAAFCAFQPAGSREPEARPGSLVRKTEPEANPGAPPENQAGPLLGKKCARRRVSAHDTERCPAAFDIEGRELLDRPGARAPPPAPTERPDPEAALDTCVVS